MTGTLAARHRAALLALVVGIVLADSSVVTIALPDVLAQYGVAVPSLSWALTSFNLALALAALPAALVARRRPAPVFAVGVVAFAAASLACALAPSFDALVAARAVQGVAGAAVVAAALDLLAAGMLDADDAARLWAFAGVVGAAVGPAAGGILTQLFGWEAIFGVQAPLVLLALAALRGGAPAGAPRERGARPHVAALAALVLVSGGLVAPLFLLVVLLINGWRLEPLAAGIAVTVLPVAAIVAARTATVNGWTRAAAGALLVAGGLAALGWLPGTGIGWTVAPQIVIGAGLGLAVAALIEQALVGRRPRSVHAGWTIAARHAGVVLGLLVLTPIFTTDLDRSEDDALAAGTAAVLDSRIPPLEKLGVARDVLVAVDEAEAEARIPAVEDVVGDRDDREYAALVASLQDQLDRAVTHAFSRSFLAAALLGLAALVPIAIAGRRAAP
jgi:MFS family permease